MKAVYVEQTHRLSIRNQTISQLGENDVLIKVAMAGICGSDIHVYNGRHPFRTPPVSIGHELSGYVEEVGSNVKNIPIGSKVTVNPQVGCGECAYCRSNQINLCENRQAPGVGNWLGAMSEYFIASANTVFVLPNELDNRAAVLVEPFAVAFHALEKANLTSGHKLAILGAGPIGLMILLAAISKGVSQNLITDIRNYPLEIGEKLGAGQVLNIARHEDWQAHAEELNGGKFDRVIVCTDSPNIIKQALQITKKGGKIITVAMFDDEHSINMRDFQGSEKEMIGCMTYNENNFEEAIQFLNETNNLEEIISNLISHILPFNEAQKGFQMVANSQEKVIKVLLEF
ncbi:zinc-dependent alcohol dehydrogenase [Oceanobacillus jeddahense]|uniref:zinc-dependent alcohol dehydrogenase n=1 Tax=Oceanobacillus jeddahense TaxID=1462527 RepID=UPI000595B8A9|nr:alcohol dehydrogenase catalytic domain-containing protein [Oceanobacillus jeddahense]